MRCVFSETLKVRTLEVVIGAPPGLTGPDIWRVVSRMLRGMGWLARAALDDVVTTVFPSDCRACGGVLVRAGLAPVCDGCIERISEQTTALCRRCGEALDMDLESDRFVGGEWSGEGPVEGLLCTPCRRMPPLFERAVAFGVHEDGLRELIHLLKYERVRATAKPLGAMLARAVEHLDLTGEVAVIAVPLHTSRERERGYNQAMLLADAAERVLRGKTQALLSVRHKVLERTRATESQLTLTPRGRRRNVLGAFALKDASVVVGRTVLLVDDVYTTGATVSECARVLLRAGAVKVFVATVSRAQPEQAARWSWDGGKGSENGGS